MVQIVKHLKQSTKKEIYRAYKGMTPEEIDSLPMSEDSYCRLCVNHLSGTNACVAFPLGIPSEYLSGKSKHDKLDGREFGAYIYDFDIDFEEY